jgi:hypothetical protein
MSVTAQARSEASRVARSDLLQWLTRAGFIGYGLIHVLVAWLALQIALGQSGAEGDQTGALNTLAAQSFGRLLVTAVAVGLAAMAVWQVLEAAIGHRDERGAMRGAERLTSVARAVVYAYLGLTAVKVLRGAKAGAADQQQQTTSDMMSQPDGRLLVGVAGFVLALVGLGLIVYGLSKRFEKHLATGRMSRRTRDISRWLGIGGYVAKGIAYGLAGLLLVQAAVTYDPSKARGLDGALRTLADRPYGGLLLGVVALGIAAFSAFCVVQARYRKV